MPNDASQLATPTTSIFLKTKQIVLCHSAKNTAETLGFLPPPISPARRWGLIKWRRCHRLHLSSSDRTETSIEFCIAAGNCVQVTPRFPGQERFRWPLMEVVIPKTQQYVECDEVPALHHECKHTSTYLSCKCAPCSGCEVTHLRAALQSSFINCLTVTFSLGCFNSISTKQYQISMRWGLPNALVFMPALAQQRHMSSPSRTS